MVLVRQLEVVTSRQQVLDAIKGVLGEPRAHAIDELVAALAASTGLDLDTYAAAWIKGSGQPDWPRYNVTFTPGTGTSTLALDHMNEKAQKRGCKFDVALRGGNGEEVLQEVDTFTGPADQTLTIPTPAFTVTQLVLDPNMKCLVFLASSTPRVIRRAWLSDRAGPFAPVPER
jgi:aminopeptidase N